MKREIKFRAWDKQKNVFIPDDVYVILSRTSFGAFGMMIEDWEDYREGEFFYDNAQELTQFTGLKDKNGKEIYEGDITDEHGDRGIVKMIHGCWCTDYIELEPHPILAKRVVEVIGNIYENPELCQQKNSN